MNLLGEKDNKWMESIPRDDSLLGKQYRESLADDFLEYWGHCTECPKFIKTDIEDYSISEYIEIDRILRIWDIIATPKYITGVSMSGHIICIGLGYDLIRLPIEGSPIGAQPARKIMIISELLNFFREEDMKKIDKINKSIKIPQVSKTKGVR